MAERLDLRGIQTWMQATMIEPEARASDEELERVVRSTPGLPARARIELYRSGYRMRLVECMRATHPALRHALGDELFDAFAAEYVERNPSRSHTLLELGAQFADHLAATRPDGHLPAAERESWPDFVIDLARLERLFLEVYEGPGAEGERLAGGDDLPAAPDPGWLGARVEAVPCLRLFRSRFPVGPYLLAARRGERPELPPPGRTWIALCRRDYAVTLAELDAPGHQLLGALAAGADLRQAAAAARLGTGDAWARLREFAARGFFRSVTPAPADAARPIPAEEAAR
jgi:hypothetical protein